eukprot:4754243-Lingulodinium_polyedra.AAC.1
MRYFVGVANFRCLSVVAAALVKTCLAPNNNAARVGRAWLAMQPCVLRNQYNFFAQQAVVFRPTAGCAGVHVVKL